jgi:hypothetical protein
MSEQFYERKEYLCSRCGVALEYHRVKRKSDSKRPGETFMAFMHPKDVITSATEPCPLVGKVYEIEFERNLVEVEDVQR